MGPAQPALAQEAGTLSSGDAPGIAEKMLWDGIQGLFHKCGYGTDGSDVYFRDLGEKDQEVVVDVFGDLLNVDETAKHLLALKEYMSQEAHAEFMLRVMRGR